MPLGRVRGAARAPPRLPLPGLCLSGCGGMAAAPRVPVRGGRCGAAAGPTCHNSADKVQLFLSSLSGRKAQPAIYFVQALNASAGFCLLLAGLNR